MTEARFAYSSTEVWETARDGQVPSLGAGSGRGGGRCPCLRPDGQWSGEDRFWVPLGVSQTSGLRSRGLWAPVLEGEGGQPSWTGTCEQSRERHAPALMRYGPPPAAVF